MEVCIICYIKNNPPMNATQQNRAIITRIRYVWLLFSALNTSHIAQTSKPRAKTRITRAHICLLMFCSSNAIICRDQKMKSKIYLALPICYHLKALLLCTISNMMIALLCYFTCTIALSHCNLVYLQHVYVVQL